MKEHPDKVINGGGRVVLAGGGGFLGRALATALDAAGYEVVVLTRNPSRHRGPGRAVEWDGRTVRESWTAELEGAAALVNLAGRSVECRRTEKNRDEILRSRVDSCEALGAALRLVYRPPSVWVQAASLAIYGDAGDRVCDERPSSPTSSPPTSASRGKRPSAGRSARRCAGPSSASVLSSAAMAAPSRNSRVSPGSASAAASARGASGSAGSTSRT